MYLTKGGCAGYGEALLTGTNPTGLFPFVALFRGRSTYCRADHAVQQQQFLGKLTLN